MITNTKYHDSHNYNDNEKPESIVYTDIMSNLFLSNLHNVVHPYTSTQIILINLLTYSCSVIDNKNNIQNLKIKFKSFTREPREKLKLIYAQKFRVQPFYHTKRVCEKN